MFSSGPDIEESSLPCEARKEAKYPLAAAFSRDTTKPTKENDNFAPQV